MFGGLLQKKQIFSWRNALILILLVGLALRVYLAFFSLNYRDNTDVLRYKDWARIAYLYGFAESYRPTHLTFGTLPNNQPPGTTYVLLGAYDLDIQAAKIIGHMTHQAPGQNLFVNGPMLTLFLRLPSVVADLVIGWLIYLIIGQLGGGGKWRLLGSALFVFNPIVWYNSAIWGQMDSVNNVFFIGSLVVLLKKKYFWAVFLFFLSLYIKFSLVFLLPFLLLFVYQMGASWKKLIAYPVLSWLILCILSFPFNRSPFIWLTRLVSNASGEMQNVTAFALNFWWVVYRPSMQSLAQPWVDMFKFSSISLSGSPEVGIELWGTPLFYWSILPIGICLAVLFFLCFKGKKQVKKENLFLVFALVALLGFVLIPRMHERYMYPVFAPLAIYVGITRRFIVEFILLSVANLLNLYLVWHPFFLSWFPLSTINNQSFQWWLALVTTVVCLWMYGKTLWIIKGNDPSK